MAVDACYLGYALNTFPIPWHRFEFCVFSPDDEYVAVGIPRARASIIDTRELRRVRTLDGSAGAAWGGCFSPDGASFASGSMEGDVVVHHFRQGSTTVMSGHRAWVHAIDYSSDGKYLATGGYDGTIRLWEPGSARPIAMLDQRAYVHDIAFSPDGSALAGAAADDSVSVWDVGRRTILSTVRFKRAVDRRAIQWSSDSKRLLVCGGDNVLLSWSTSQRTWTECALDGVERVRAWRLLQHSNEIVVADTNGEVSIWDVERASKVAQLKGGAQDVEQFRSSKDGTELIGITSRPSVLRWRRSGDQMETLAEFICSSKQMVAVASDCRTVATVDDAYAVSIWDIESGKCRGSIALQRETYWWWAALVGGLLAIAVAWMSLAKRKANGR
jgi:WD40 repeat protein